MHQSPHGVWSAMDLCLVGLMGEKFENVTLLAARGQGMVWSFKALQSWIAIWWKESHTHCICGEHKGQLFSH